MPTGGIQEIWHKVALKYPVNLKFQGNKQLVDKAKKFLAISKKSNEKEGVTKKEDEQIVLVAFTGTRIKLYYEDKLMIEGQRRLNDRRSSHVEVSVCSLCWIEEHTIATQG